MLVHTPIFNGDKPKVLVAMSGGVDSSVAAALLKEQGYDCVGVTMQLWDYSKNESSCEPNAKFDTCCSLDDVADARMVAHKLNIPFYVFDYQEEFKTSVVDYFVDEYLSGKTPNPCVACNTFLKFDLLLNRAQRLGCDYIATGHYARIEFDESLNEYKLLAGDDPGKDQSYFLYSMNQDILKKILFPLGHLSKPEVRKIAEKYDLINANKKESMEICFIPNNDYAKFVKSQSHDKKIIAGKIYHEDGSFLSNHEGIHQFTVGQRKGLGISYANPIYVTRIDSLTGDVFVGEEKYLYRNGFSFNKFHSVRNIDHNSEKLSVKIRYRSQKFSGHLETIHSHEDLAKHSFVFDEPQKSVAPGQIAVLYVGNEVVGGGFIDRVLH